MNDIFERETIRILRAPPDGERGTELAVVRFRKQGIAYPPQLSNQEIYIDKLDGKRKYGKVKGLKLEDVKTIQENLPEILRLLEKYAPETKPKPEKKSAAAGEQEVPWND